jgi:hypothetical protein
MRRSTTLAALAAIALLACTSGQAMTTWQGNYTATTTATITHATHGIGNGMIGVVCVDSGGNRLTLDQVSWTVDQSTYEVDITFASAFTGSVKLSGPWPSSDTGNATDFAVTIGTSDASNLWVCRQCDTYTARRTVSGKTYTANSGEALQWLDTSASMTVYVYGVENHLVFGLSASTCSASQWTAGPTVSCASSGVPSGALPFASATMVNGVFTAVTDLRPW